MTAKEIFELPYEDSAHYWDSFPATVKREFGLSPRGVPMFVIFKPGEVVENCSFGNREYADKTKWIVRLERCSLFFEIPAPVFFHFFDA